MTGPREKKQTSRGAFTMERRCLGCNMPKSVRSFGPGTLCKQCRDHGPPKRTALVVEPDPALEDFIAKARELAGCPRRSA